LKNLLRRLRRAGLKEGDSILDYGCGNGIFVDFLPRNGFPKAIGYDPYVETFSHPPLEGARFDCIVVNDAIEHVDDVRAVLRECRQRLSPGGMLYIGTVESDGLDMQNLEPHRMKLHQPFHRVFLKESVLHSLCREHEFEIVTTYKRSYLDTLTPFANYRFLDELSKALNHNMDHMLDPAKASKAFLKTPRLLFYGLFGYFFPTAFEPAVVLRTK
jgi:2-polyprenyl-3-methyl-5-hydroxy-6-metoxy-1,4-benzoquinol methylase